MVVHVLHCTGDHTRGPYIQGVYSEEARHVIEDMFEERGRQVCLANTEKCRKRLSACREKVLSLSNSLDKIISSSPSDLDGISDARIKLLNAELEVEFADKCLRATLKDTTGDRQKLIDIGLRHPNSHGSHGPLLDKSYYFEPKEVDENAGEGLLGDLFK